MITAVDTNVLLDVFGADPRFGEASKQALRRCLQEGQLVACSAVWAEVASCYPEAARASEALGRLGVKFSALSPAASERAGATFRTWRQRGGQRQRVVADFLIGAHAMVAAERLLTRDRGFYRACFDGLVVLEP